jgi:nicotinamide-nucleotide amidase
MKAEIIAVGTELLTPYFQDTNSLYVTERLNDLGITVSFKTLVGDDERDLRRAIKTALGRSGLVIAMGGLGPTEDDRTREVFARVIGRKLVFDRKIRAGIRERFRRRGVRMVSTNLKQCYVIEGSEVLENPNGTAPGLWLEIPSHKIALLPGPPHELRPMIDRQVIPRLAAVAKGITVRRTLRLTGIGESLMESRIKRLYREAGGPRHPPDVPRRIHGRLRGRAARRPPKEDRRTARAMDLFDRRRKPGGRRRIDPERAGADPGLR